MNKTEIRRLEIAQLLREIAQEFNLVGVSPQPVDVSYRDIVEIVQRRGLFEKDISYQKTRRGEMELTHSARSKMGKLLNEIAEKWIDGGNGYEYKLVFTARILDRVKCYEFHAQKSQQDDAKKAPEPPKPTRRAEYEKPAILASDAPQHAASIKIDVPLKIIGLSLECEIGGVRKIFLLNEGNTKGGFVK